MVAAPTTSGVAAGTGFANDPLLPGRDGLLDERAMGSMLGDALNLSDLDCRLVRTKYRLGESIRVSYEVAAGDHRPLRISFRGFTANRFDPDLEASPVGSHDLVLRDVSALGWIFPGDRKLTSLRRFWNDREVHQRVLGSAAATLELMAYAPEKAATIRCDVAGQTVGFAKLYAGTGAQEAVDIYDRLGPPLNQLTVRTPQIEAFDEELGLVLLSPAEGQTIASRHRAIDWYRLGCATARLHQVDPPLALPRFERSTMARLRKAGRVIASARPDVAPEVEGLLEALERAAGRFDPGPDVLLHGDLHGKNVLCTDRHLTFIDLDQAAIGPAAAELGSAIAALRYDAPAPVGTTTRTAPAITRFETQLLEGYQTDGRLPSDEALHWHVAAALLGERALRAVNRVRLDGLVRLPLVLKAALNTVEGRHR